MDQLYPIPDPAASSCASQDFDFLNYWVDQSVEKEIQRGKKLKELKQRPMSPTLRKQKYDVINIGHTNIYSEKKHKRRSKSPHKTRKKTGRSSPKRKVRKPKKASKSSQRCPMRVAELSVPSKRQCIDTWRYKNHVLPAIMIDRLRQHVLDLSPVAKISDALECFKTHKKFERKKKKETQRRKNKMAIKECDCPKKVKVKLTNIQQYRYLCAIFGHKIVKQLNKPAQIFLDSELKNISNIVYAEIEKLIHKSKGVTSTKFIKNKRIQAEVADKITIWISNILEESAYNILEDQLKDLEEEAGPVLDLIDDFVDDVVDFCESKPEVTSHLDTTSLEQCQEEEKEGKAEEEETKEEESRSGSIDTDTVPVEDIEEFIQNELDKIISSFDKDGVYVDDIGIDDDKFTYTEDQPNTNKTHVDKEENEFVDANYSLEIPLEEIESHANLEKFEDHFQADENPNNDQERGTDDSVSDLISEDDNNKKVKFSDVHMVTFEDVTRDRSEINPLLHTEQFASPNVNLLSDADESWPDDMTLPLVRPSESVSRSVTSLGKITEDDERISIMLDNNTKIKDIPDDRRNDVSQDERSEIDDFSNQHDQVNQDINKFQEEIDDLLNQKLQEQLRPVLLETKANVIKLFTQIEPLQTLSTNDNSEDDKIKLLSEEQLPENQQSIESGDDKIEFVTETTSLELKPLSYKAETIESTIQTVPLSELPANKFEDGMDNGQKEQTHLEPLNKDGIAQIIVSIVDNVLSQDEPTTANKLIQMEPKTLIPPSSKVRVDSISFDQKERNIELVNKYIIEQEEPIHPVNHCLSTDSTFPNDVPTVSAEYVHKLSKITEQENVTIENKLTGQASIKDDDDTSKLHEDKIKTTEIATNTSYSLISRADISISVSSQSLGYITKYLQPKKQDWFSSVRIKPKDYKVDIKSAPKWVSRSIGEPSQSAPRIQSKATHDKNIRMWCKDLENGFDNLELWSGWLEKTVHSINIIEMKKARICLDKSREQFVRDLLHLKKNVDADVQTWTKMSKSTQEKMKSFRKIYPSLEVSVGNVSKILFRR